MADEPFVQRIFTVDDRDVTCRFFRPEEVDGGSFFCHYEIDWVDGTQRRRAGGFDEVQALILAMSKAHTDLLAAREHDGRQVAWQGDQSLGLPILDAVRDWDPGNRF